MKQYDEKRTGFTVANLLSEPTSCACCLDNSVGGLDLRRSRKSVAHLPPFISAIFAWYFSA